MDLVRKSRYHPLSFGLEAGHEAVYIGVTYKEKRLQGQGELNRSLLQICLSASSPSLHSMANHYYHFCLHNNYTSQFWQEWFISLIFMQSHLSLKILLFLFQNLCCLLFCALLIYHLLKIFMFHLHGYIHTYLWSPWDV